MVMIGVRYVLPGSIAFVGLLFIALIDDREVAWEIGAMFIGSAIAVLMINFFFRLGVEGDKDRDREEAARAYFDQHGHWPDEPGS